MFLRIGRKSRRLYLILFLFLFLVPIDKNSEKMVLTVDAVRLTLHKETHPDASDEPNDIGLSSEEEAEEMEESEYIRRKYHQQVPPPPVTESTPVTTTATASTSTSTTTSAGTATIEVPVAALQQVHEILGKIIGGQAPLVSTEVGPSDPQPEGGVPFSVPRPKRGEKACKICFRKFWSTDTLKKHIKTHTGDQKYSCPNPGCGRKVASKRGLEVHLTTCQKEKTHFW